MNIAESKSYRTILGYFWKTDPVEFTYPRFLDSFKKILLIMPRDKKSYNILNLWREKIILALGNKQIIVLSIGSQIESLHSWSQKPMLFTETDVNFASIVSSKIVKDIMKNRFQLAIDLSPDFDFITAQIALRAKIPTRIGIMSEKSISIGKKYFNIVVSGDFSHSYEQLVKLLSI